MLRDEDAKNCETIFHIDLALPTSIADANGLILGARIRRALRLYCDMAEVEAAKPPSYDVNEPVTGAECTLGEGIVPLDHGMTFHYRISHWYTRELERKKKRLAGASEVTIRLTFPTNGRRFVAERVADMLEEYSARIRDGFYPPTDYPAFIDAGLPGSGDQVALGNGASLVYEISHAGE